MGRFWEILDCLGEERFVGSCQYVWIPDERNWERFSKSSLHCDKWKEKTTSAQIEVQKIPHNQRSNSNCKGDWTLKQIVQRGCRVVLPGDTQHQPKQAAPGDVALSRGIGLGLCKSFLASTALSTLTWPYLLYSNRQKLQGDIIVCVESIYYTNIISVISENEHIQNQELQYGSCSFLTSYFRFFQCLCVTAS